MIDDETKREFEATIGLNLALLKFSGVVSHERRFVSRNVLAVLGLFCITIFSVSYVHEFATNLNDVASMLESFAMVIPLVGGQARYMAVLWFRDSCRAMLNVCEYFWSTLNSYEKAIVRSYTNKATLLTRFYVAVCVLTIFLVLIFSLISAMAVEHAKHDISDNVTTMSSENASSLAPSETNGEPLNPTGNNKRYLPYAFFVDVQETPWYEVVYVLQITFMMNVGFTCVGADTIGPLFILITCGYFDVIRSRIENSHLLESTGTTTEATLFDRAESSANVDTKKLRTCVIHHQLLLKFCKDIQQLTSLVFLTQLFGSTYNISLVGFKLVSDNPDKSRFVTQVVIFVMQLFICNWPPDLLLSKSEAISRAAYSMPWYQYPCSLRNPTNLLIIRSQRPVCLTAGKFAVLSLETFASMISTAASFFTMIRSVN